MFRSNGLAQASHYATGSEGRVEIESEWTARKRERREDLSSSRTFPLKPKPGLSGPPPGELHKTTTRSSKGQKR